MTNKAQNILKTNNIINCQALGGAGVGMKATVWDWRLKNRRLLEASTAITLFVCGVCVWGGGGGMCVYEHVYV